MILERIIILFGFIFYPIHGYTDTNDIFSRRYSEDYFVELGTGNGNNDRGLFPNIFNLATNAIISANATCGKKGPESYCKLVEHVFMRTPQCDACDDNHPQKRHPIEFAVDGTNRWWQSPTLANGLEYEWVTITLNLRQQYQVAYIIVKSAIAPRPGNWILERSLDDVEWKPWQYFAVNDEECERIYGVKALPGVPRFERDDSVVCTSLYSRLDPLENGEIHISLVNGRPGTDGPSLALQEFTKARYIRLRFQKLKTLNSDLIFITGRRIDESVTRRYFYAIRDISVGGQCICYGHAESCPADPATGQLRCECKHNTCGESCNECCPLYNQKPWQPGTITLHNACEPCQCFNHAERCEYNEETDKQRLSLTPDGLYEGGGVCVDCQHNTQGINCQECKDNYFRPAGVPHHSSNPCRPCDCELSGSTSGLCIKDDTLTSDDLKPGDCRCKLGFGGTRCDRCALGFRNYPVCDPCPCHRAGSANFATCDDKCICKRNVEGALCDKCKKGFFNLDEDNLDGCTPCFCFGMTSECKELDWGKYQIREMNGWNLTDMDIVLDVQIPHNTSGTSLTMNSREIPDRSLFYWKSPKVYRGNLLTSYNGDIKYFVYYVTEGNGHPMHLPDVIIKGNGLTMEHHSRRTFNDKENVSISIRLHEAADWYEKSTRRPVDKTQFMQILSNVEAFLIRALYHQSQLQASIYSVSLDSAKMEATSLQKFTSVEQCSCPTNFVGLSCESCVSGFRRVNNELYKGKCEACSCNEHSSICDHFTGNCLECQHNTTGHRCEHCTTGHFGNPSLKNSAGACKMCGCPLTNAKNNFSPTCMLDLGGNGDPSDNDYICTACPPGHMGNKCEWCADGFFGDPMVPGNYCQPCNCNENIDPAAIGNCDRKTGNCLKCIGNTEGWNCERCKPNFYGSALNHDCKACGCNMFGSTISQCDSVGGECQCKEHYIGVRCDRCQEGFGDVENGCPKCNCNSIGSHSERCDPASGQCQCKPGVFGKHCDTCSTGYFGFSESGCRYCGCYAAGSVDEGKCDTITGQCVCKPHVSGQMCTLCDDGFFNITSGLGCQPCNCHTEGADDKTCDQLSGQCRCKYGVTGTKCDKCDSNFYGLSQDGCKQCPICPAAGHVCDPVTGQCVCPPFTVGDMCEFCSPDTWNYDPYKGCEPCACDSAGSVKTGCDLQSGACFCRPGYTGKKCDQCTHGHFNFPSCDKCECNLSGTEPRNCLSDSGCSCSAKGQCPCKKNVINEKCDECDPTSFSLESDNPKGCTECFCFNRTNFCIQSSFIWQQIGAESRTAFFTKPWLYWERINGLQVLPAGPANLHAYPTDYTPLYWSMPAQFVGDKVTTYNGYLRFRVTNTNGNYLEGAVRPDTRFFEQFPSVVLVGNHRIILEHFKKVSEINENGAYVVKFREDFWKARHNPEIPVTRQTLMAALQNVQALYIRATYIERAGQSNLTDISLDVGVSDKSATTANNTAVGVEACDCPDGYAGQSCQNSADGYCRRKKPNYLDNENDLDLVGWSERCSCNQHSDMCDRETCRCSDCLHNTGGDFCEKCAVGFYGDAKRGTLEDCKKCACPTAAHSFSKSCYPVNYGEGYVCDQCQVGHTGLYCENCISGYYGDPVLNQQACRPCQCNRYGSLSDVCDTKNGMCTCRRGVTGRDCSECQSRHALIGADCRSCDEGCTKELMMDVDQLEMKLDGFNLTGMVPAPWGRLARIENETRAMRLALGDVKSGEEKTKEMVRQLGDVKKYFSDAQNLMKQVKYIEEKMNKSVAGIDDIVDHGQQVLKEVEGLRKKIQDIHDLLIRYKVSGGGDRTVPVNVTQWLLESANLLKEMENTTRYLDKRFNFAEQSLLEAKKLLEEVNSKKFNDTTLKMLGAKIVNITQRLTDAKRLVFEDVQKNASSAEAILKITEKMLAEFKRVVAYVEDTKKDCEDLATDAKDKMVGIKKSLLDIYDQFTFVNDTLFDELDNATDQCQMREDHLSSLLPSYREKYLFPAQKHAEDLELRAAQLTNTFAPIKDQSHLSVEASEAYSNIKKAIENAAEASQKAKNASDVTYAQVLTDVGDSIVTRSKASLDKSNELLTQAQDLSTKELSDSLMQYEKRLKDIDEKIFNTRKSVNEIEPRFHKFDDVNVEVEIVVKDAKNARVKAEAVSNKTTTLAESTEELNAKVKELAGFTGKGFGNITTQVQKAAEGVATATKQLQDLQEYAENNKGKLEDVAESLSFLKEKIKEAREKASKIKISVQSTDPDTCIRTYASPAAPSPANTLHVEYRPTDDVADSLIFLTKTKSRRSRPTTEFLALELRDKRFVFIWNVGSEPGSPKMVTVTQTITAFAKKAHESWYHIDVERKGNFGNLTVSVAEKNGQKSQTNSMQRPDSGENSVIFNTDPFNTDPTVISLGLKDASEKPSGVQSHQFKGTVGEIVFDDHTIPLWNFLSDDDNGMCKGYYRSHVDEPVDQSYLFADGYIQIPAVKPYRAQQTQLQLTFSTYSENGLIYFRGNPTSKDFVSLELDEGHLKAQFNLGGNSKLSLRTDKSYNDGRKYSVQLNRNELEVQLDISGTETEKKTATIPGKFKSLEADTDHLLGGVPESYPKKEWKAFNVQWKGFYGCIGSRVKVETYLDFLSANKTLNVKPGCTFSGVGPTDVLVTSDRVVSFEGDGLFVVQGIEFGPVSTFGVNFRSGHPEGLLFYQSSQVSTRRRRDTANGKGFFAGYLYLCTFVMTLATSHQDILTLQTSLNLCDGKLHTVYVKRTDYEVFLFIDDDLATSGMLKSNDVIGSTRGQLFLGGLGLIVPPNNELPIYAPFTGCLSDMYLNFKRFLLIPQRLDNASLGFCIESAYARAATDKTAGSVQGTEPMLDDGFAESELRHGRLLLDELPAVDYSDDSADGFQTATTKKQPFLKSTTLPVTCIDSQYMEAMDNALLYGLKVESFSGISFKKNHNLTDVSISMQFRTDHPNGTLVAWPNKDFNNSLFILLENGIVLMKLKVGKMVQPLVFNSEKGLLLNDGNWHSVSMLKKSGSLSLQIDNQSELYKDKIPLKWSLKRSKGGLMIGGVRRSIAKKFDILYEPLPGCIRKFLLDGKSKDLMQQGRGAESCRTSRGNGLYFKSVNGSAVFENFPIKSLTKIYLEFRADKELNGRMLSFIQPSQQFLLKLNKGQIESDINVAMSQFSSTLESPSMCDNSWHKLSLSIGPNGIKWNLDNTFDLSIPTPKDFDIFTSWTGDVYVGNILDTEYEKNIINFEPGFIGCLRSLKINDVLVDFTKANKIRLAVMNECPF